MPALARRSFSVSPEAPSSVGVESAVDGDKGEISRQRVFAGHTDVVPPGPLAEWESPPRYAFATTLVGCPPAVRCAGPVDGRPTPSAGTCAAWIASDDGNAATESDAALLDVRSAAQEPGEANSPAPVGLPLLEGRLQADGWLRIRLAISGARRHPWPGSAADDDFVVAIAEQCLNSPANRLATTLAVLLESDFTC